MFINFSTELKMENLSFIPKEIWEQILYYLDVKDITQLYESKINEYLGAIIDNKWFWFNKASLSGIAPEYFDYFELTRSSDPKSIYIKLYRPTVNTGYFHLDNYDKFLSMYSYVSDYIRTMERYNIDFIFFLKTLIISTI